MGVTNRADNEHEPQDLISLGSPPPHQTPPPVLTGPPASDRLRTHWAVLEETLSTVTDTPYITQLHTWDMN